MRHKFCSQVSRVFPSLSRLSAEQSRNPCLGHCRLCSRRSSCCRCNLPRLQEKEEPRTCIHQRWSVKSKECMHAPDVMYNQKSICLKFLTIETPDGPFHNPIISQFSIFLSIAIIQYLLLGHTNKRWAFLQSTGVDLSHV